jgi:hypothetical protein
METRGKSALSNAPPRWRRIAAAFAVALTLALSAYVLMNRTSVASVAFGSLWFLGVFPAFLCSLICYVGDPDGERGRGFYWLVPVALVAIVDFGSTLILHEGVICVAMLTPIWLGAGWIGAFTSRARRRPVDPNVFNASLLMLPLLAGLFESQFPAAHDHVSLSRQIVIAATPGEIWPYAVSNAHIAASEGRWTLSQNIIGLPRPRATVLRGQGVGAVRTAYWGDHINFDEIITQWRPGRRLGWRFSFTNSSMQDYTDKHISPDGQFLKIDTGDYVLTPLTPRTTLLTLETHYIAKTHVNPYAELWGELLLGDVQDNILAIIRHRAEAAHARRATLLAAN